MEKIDKITWEIRDDIGIITLDNPPENYLVRPEFLPYDTLKKWTSYDYLKGILICGSGKHFSGGGKLENLYEMIKANEDIASRMEEGKAVLDHLENLTIPIAAAIQGICFGGGLEIALACHIRVCSENALFAFPEINSRVLPGLGGTVRFHELAGFPESMKMILGGDMINAEDALELKLVDQITPKATLFDHTFNLLKKMTYDRPMEVIHGVMQALQNARKLSHLEAMQQETRIFCELALTEARRRNKNNAK
ncbi:MAG: enoyl-CoA hydratase/isomerase family protein [Bacteroidales bacterium]|jgi:enoyl-CoA hydratase/carnithine racemase|nr:enoyl-CoA hydratase/isomerase family protein [Bacteroidales bacterium]